MKRILAILVALLALFVLTFALTACEEEESECVHNYIVLKQHPATCTEVASTDYQCTRCNGIFNEPTGTEKLEHDYEVDSTDDGDCKTKSKTTYKCADCGKTKTEEGDLGLHDYEVLSIIEDATCTKAGSQNVKCSICGDERTKTILPKGHDKETIVVEATCTQKGYTSDKCKNCDYEYKYAEQPYKPHVFSNSVCTGCKVTAYDYTVAFMLKYGKRSTVNNSYTYTLTAKSEGETYVAVLVYMVDDEQLAIVYDKFVLFLDDTPMSYVWGYTNESLQAVGSVVPMYIYNSTSEITISETNIDSSLQSTYAQLCCSYLKMALLIWQINFTTANFPLSPYVFGFTSFSS